MANKHNNYILPKTVFVCLFKTALKLGIQQMSKRIFLIFLDQLRTQQHLYITMQYSATVLQ